MNNLIDWRKWHNKYESDDSLKTRLEAVKDMIKSCLPKDNNKPFTILDIGAGDGRVIIEALRDYPEPTKIHGLLIEIDRVLAMRAREALQDTKLSNLTVLEGDASLTINYTDIAPVDLVLLCGIFGNISDRDIQQTIQALPMLLKPGGRVIWTRNTRKPDKIPMIKDLFESNGLVEAEFVVTKDTLYAVGANEYTASETLPLKDDVKLFTFIK